MDFDSMAFQDQVGVAPQQRDSGDESTTSSFGSPSGGLHLLWSAVQEVTSSSESDDAASCDLFDQTPLSTNMSRLATSTDPGPHPRYERVSRNDRAAFAAAVSRGRRAAIRSQKQAELAKQALASAHELSDSPFIDLDSVAPLGKRAQTALSCVRCRTTHKKCDETRPCQRCVKLGCDNDCHDAAPRGAKHKSRGSSSKQKQRSTLPEPKVSPYTSPDLSYLNDDVAPFLAAEHKLPPPPSGLPSISEWPRQLHYHPHPQPQAYPFYSPPSYLAPLPSSISSSSGSSSVASSLSPPRLPLPSLYEGDRAVDSSQYNLPYLPPPSQPYYSMYPFNHDPTFFR